MRTSSVIALVIALCLTLLAGSAFAANLLQNPGFESGATGWTASLRSPSTGAVVIDPAVAHSGSNYWVASAPDGSDATTWVSAAQGSYDTWTSGVTIPISDQKYYRLSAWVKIPTAATAPVDMTLRYRWQPSGDRVDVGLQTVNTDGWVQLVSAPIKPLAGDNTCGYFEVHSNAMTTYYLDDCALEDLDPYVVTGKVVDQDGNPIAGANVALDAAQDPLSVTTPAAKTTTDANGNYTCKFAPVAGTYYVNASSPIYQDLSGPQTVTVPPSPTTAQDIVLQVLPLCKVSGRVFDQATGAGIAGVKVGASYSSGVGIGPDSLTAVSDSNGNYSIQLIAGQIYYLIVRKFGVVPAGDTREWELWTMDDSGNPKDITLDIPMVKDQPLVKVDAAGLQAGSVASWTNTGTLGGAFEPIGTNPPVATSQAIYQSVYFDNNPMVLMKDGARVLAPAAITGSSANYTVCAWLYDTEMPDQQTYVAWAKRGGPDGSNCEMAYGTNTTWGAAGHWGAPDLSWGAAYPSAGLWHNVIICWDGLAETAYIDGVKANSETKTLSIAPDLPIVLGAGYDYSSDSTAEDYQTIYPGVVFSGHMARVEVYANICDEADAQAIAAGGPDKLPVSTITGKVVTTDGTEPSGYTVTATTPAGDIGGIAITGADGLYSIVVAAPGSYVVSATKAGYAVMPAPQAASFTEAGKTAVLADFTATPSSISGVVKDAVTGQPIYNAVVQIGGRKGDAMVTNEDGAYTFAAAGGCGGIEIFADAMGYHCANLLVTSGGNVTKTILLTPEAETGILRNGEMEDPFTDEWVKAVSESATFKQSTDARHGQYSLWYTNQNTDYGGIRQDVQLTPGYLYTFYMRGKADAGVGAWQPMFEFSDADGGHWNGFVSAEPDYTEWYHTPPREWYTYLKWFDRNGTHNGPAVRVSAPDGATMCYWICLMPSQSPMPDANSGCYIDSAVVDKVAINEPLVSTTPDGDGKVYGANNKSVQTDGKLVGKTVRAWGKVLSVDGTTSFVMSDGYSTGVTVKISGVTLPAGFGQDKMAVVTGVVNADKSIQAASVSAF